MGLNFLAAEIGISGSPVPRLAPTVALAATHPQMLCDINMMPMHPLAQAKVAPIEGRNRRLDTRTPPHKKGLKYDV